MTETAEPPLPRLRGAGFPGAPSEVRGLDGYALALRRAGQPIRKYGGTWWREVRPCFFRPILPFLEVPRGAAGLPFRAALGGCQYPSNPGGRCPNSFLPYVAFTGARDYEINRLSHSHRWEVLSAEKRCAIRAFTNCEEFKAHAHSVYVEFHHRTEYRYLEKRCRRREFERWADAELADPGVVALGAWTDNRLIAVSLSRVVGEAWVYCSYFGSYEALRLHAAASMLHYARCLAAAFDGIEFVFAGMQKRGLVGRMVDAFYLHRGASVVRRPALLRINPAAEWALARVRPDLLQHLRGEAGLASTSRPV